MSDLDAIFPGPDKPRGQVTIRVSDAHDAFLRNEVVVLAEQRLPPSGDQPARTIGAWIPVSRQAMDDAFMQGHMAGAFDRWLRPWRYPDPNPMPRFTPYPRLERAAMAIGGARRWWQDRRADAT